MAINVPLPPFFYILKLYTKSRIIQIQNEKMVLLIIDYDMEICKTTYDCIMYKQDIVQAISEELIQYCAFIINAAALPKNTLILLKKAAAVG